MLENKIFKTIVAIGIFLMICTVGSTMIKFMPVILKIAGFVLIAGAIWLFIKFIKENFGKSKK